MIDQLKQWWAGRSGREQLLVAFMLLLLVPVLLWLLLLRPVNAALETARSDQWAASERLAQVRADALALKTPARPAAQPAQVIVMQASGAAGLVPTRLDPGSEGRAMLSLAAVKPAALRTFLRSLDAQGVFVETITIRANSDATVSVDAVLRGRRAS